MAQQLSCFVAVCTRDKFPCVSATAPTQLSGASTHTTHLSATYTTTGPTRNKTNKHTCVTAAGGGGTNAAPAGATRRSSSLEYHQSAHWSSTKPATTPYFSDDKAKDAAMFHLDTEGPLAEEDLGTRSAS